MCCARKDNRVRMAHNARPASDMAFIFAALDLTVACCVGYSHTDSIDFCVYRVHRVLMPDSAHSCLKGGESSPVDSCESVNHFHVKLSDAYG